MKPFNKRAGLTLVETMVIALVIGILAMVAVPNYRRFKNHARQAEAKGRLASLYTAEAGFYADHKSYTECTAGILTPTADQDQRYYAYGFLISSNHCGSGANLSCVAMDWNATAVTQACPMYDGFYDQDIPATRKASALAWASYLLTTVAPFPWVHPQGGAPTQADSKHYVAAAAGIITTDATSSSDFDVWMINQDRELVNSNSGL